MRAKGAKYTFRDLFGKRDAIRLQRQIGRTLVHWVVYCGEMRHA